MTATTRTVSETVRLGGNIRPDTTLESWGLEAAVQSKGGTVKAVSVADTRCSCLIVMWPSCQDMGIQPRGDPFHG